MKLLEAAQNRDFGNIHKLVNYFDEYDFMLRDYLDREISLLEIGVQNGGSLAMWKKYFPKAHITGIDINPDCARFRENGVNICIGSQSDADFLKTVNDEYGPFDIMIDDGGHTMNQQLTSFNTLFPLLKDGGIYSIEDLHTSYWRKFGFGGTVRRIKKLIDDIHYWAPQQSRANLRQRIKNKLFSPPKPDFFQENVRSIYIADSICFIRKQKILKYQNVKM